MSKLDILLKLADLAGDDTDSEPTFPFEGPVIVRTVTNYFTGRVSRTAGGFVVLTDAAWIADTGRWSDALKTGSLNEVEPYPDEVAVSLGSIIDVARWDHDLPRTKK